MNTNQSSLFSALSPGAVSLAPADFAQACSLAQAGGFGGVEIPVSGIDGPDAIDAFRETLFRHELRPAGWGLPFAWRADEAAWRAGITQLPAWTATAAELGANRAITWVLSFSDDRDYEDNVRFHIDRLSPVASILSDFGCRLGLEYLGPRTIRTDHRHEFVHTLEGMLDLCRGVGSNTGLLLDSWHWYTAGETIDTLSGLSASDIVYVHVNDAPVGIPLDEQIDNKRCLPVTTGVIPIGSFLKAVARTGYDGPVVPEPFDSSLAELPDDMARVTTVGESMNRAWNAAEFSSSKPA